MGEGVLGRGDLAPDRVAALAVERLAGAKVALGDGDDIATPALGCPVGSPRNAPDNTDMPSSSPIKWQSLFIAACPSGAETSADDRPARNRGQWPLSTGREHDVIGIINPPQTAALQRNHPNETLRSPWPRSHHISFCMQPHRRHTA